jgi:Rap1a immunity proteins
LAALLCAVLWSAAAKPAAAAPPSDLLQSCGAVIAGGRTTGVSGVDIPSRGLHCWYYMSAVQEMSVLVDQNGQSLLGICAPEKTTLLDYVRIFVRYAHQTGDKAQQNDAAVAVEALNAAFPCGRRGTAGPRPSKSPA